MGLAKAIAMDSRNIYKRREEEDDRRAVGQWLGKHAANLSHEWVGG